ncbi:hypothetical protein CDL12_10856 [Handroanthus impetiginosus]|uniref:Uncharacterized protein n=1 Tax=Handroanthus impetiginosus TaxID=429701 RepID=A0A2G9HGR3_9LAMI|nr:hypothetical protein CDL12_10856 [Handroanthus impetiginosus]
MSSNNYVEGNNNGGRQYNYSGGSIYPKERKHVSTKVGKKIAEGFAKAGKSVVDTVKNHKNKSKVKLDS